MSDKNRTEVNHRTRAPARRVLPYLSFQRRQFIAGDLKVRQQSVFVWSTIGPSSPASNPAISYKLTACSCDYRRLSSMSSSKKMNECWLTLITLKHGIRLLHSRQTEA